MTAYSSDRDGRNEREVGAFIPKAFVFTMSAEDLLSKKCLDICLLMGSTEIILLCAFHPYAAFAASQPTSFPILFYPPVLMKRRSERPTKWESGSQTRSTHHKGTYLIFRFLSCFVFFSQG